VRWSSQWDRDTHVCKQTSYPTSPGVGEHCELPSAETSKPVVSPAKLTEESRVFPLSLRGSRERFPRHEGSFRPMFCFSFEDKVV
jgi:hypothetical protein